MRTAFITAILIISAIPVTAQRARVQRFTAPLAGTADLSAIEDKYDARVYSLEMPEPDGEAERVRLEAAKKQSAQVFPRQRIHAAGKTTLVPGPVVALAYPADTLPGIPPDNDMAISKANRSVSVINSSIAVHNAATGQMLYRKGLRSFSSAVGLNSFINDYRYDPKLIYDPEADRFICVMLNGINDHNWIVVGFSKTNRPDSTWNFYKFYGNYADDTTWFDYPSIAVTKTEFFLTGNKIKFNASWQAGFTQTLVYQFNKQSGYNGDALITYQIWDSIGYNGKSIRNLYPVKGGGALMGPEQYFLSNRNFDVQNDTVFLVKLPDTIGSSNTNLTVTPLVSNLSYGVPPDGRQPDTSVTLATNDGRILGAFAAFGEIQFVSTSVHPVSGSSSVYHGRISNYAGAPALQADHFGIDTLDMGYPNLAFTGTNSGKVTSVISFNYSGPGAYPGMGAICFDGTQYSDMTLIKSGDSCIKQLAGKEQRWGDYMGSQPDWNSIGTVWVEGIYGRSNKDYGNYIAQLVSPFTNQVPYQNNLSAAVLYPNPGFEYIRFEFDLTKDEALEFSLYDMQGRRVDEILRQRCEPGRNRVQFNIASLPPGTYILSARGGRGKEVMTRKFTKQ